MPLCVPSGKKATKVVSIPPSTFIQSRLSLSYVAKFVRVYVSGLFGAADPKILLLGVYRFTKTSSLNS